MTPPPAFTAIFSSKRSPGCVFLVSTIKTEDVFRLLFTASTYFFVIVAIPHRRPNILRTVLSQETIVLASPDMLATVEPDLTRSASLKKFLIFTLFLTFSKIVFIQSIPLKTRACFAIILALTLIFLGIREKDVISSSTPSSSNAI